ncbi:reverse transcriptase domain-containing protein [Tanacetum coccineum]
MTIFHLKRQLKIAPGIWKTETPYKGTEAQGKRKTADGKAINPVKASRDTNHVSDSQENKVKPLGTIELDVCFGGMGECRRQARSFHHSRDDEIPQLLRMATVVSLDAMVFECIREGKKALAVESVQKIAIKGQILANFINEVPVGSEAMVPQETQYTIDHEKDCKEEWVLYTDGASSAKGSGIGLILINPTMTEYTYALRLNFESTNNQAEYEALLAGLRIAKKMGVQSLSVNVDSNWTKEYIGCLKSFKIQNIPRNKNQKADVLSKLASVAFNHLTKEILVETLDVPLMDMEEINVVVEEKGEPLIHPTSTILERGVRPEDPPGNEARCLTNKDGPIRHGRRSSLFKRS